MTLIKLNQKPLDKTFQNLVDELLSPFPVQVNSYVANGKISVPVNITETGSEYKIDVVAPGLSKENFNISLDQQFLTISAELKEDEVKEDVRQVRREYVPKSFKRVFNLDDKVIGDNITANYENGVLRILLPKKEEVKNGRTKISVQ